jgi:pimeloyl-ACP methyl ester carboxylesterase
VATDVYELTYADVTGDDRTVLAEVRLPSRQTAATVPVVVWSHGGSTGKSSTRRVGVEWGKAMNGAGFAFVALAHPGRDDASRARLCDAIEIVVCAEFKYLLWDRLHDASIVFDWLEQMAERGDLFVDLDRLVYGGHSAGAMAVMVMAGMDSPYASEVPMPVDVRPAAFLAASPPGATENRLSSSSFVRLDRPILLLTGENDTTGGTTGADRLAVFDLIVWDQAMLVSTMDDRDVGHTTFDLDAAPCRRSGGSQRRCTEVVRALGATAKAFLRSALSADGLDPTDLVTQSASRLPDQLELTAA